VSPLARRLLIAAWGIPLLLVTAYFGGLAIRAVAALAGMLAAFEAYALLNPGGRRHLMWPVALLALIVPFWVEPGLHIRLPFLMLAALLALGFTVLTVGVASGRKAIMATLGLPIYPIVPFLYFVWLRDLYGWQAVFLLFALLWVGDTAAYAGGRLMGRRPLAPEISPHKTVEGAVWALIFSVITAWAAHVLWLDGRLTLLWTLVAGVVVWAFGMVGDLFESMLKRGAGVKDSSNLLSEHGGVLDRFDSLLFAVMPLFYIFHWVT